MLKTLIFTFLFTLHPVHVSLMSVEYDEGTESFRIFIKVFFDDFLADAGIIEITEVPDINIADYDKPDNKFTEEYFNDRVLISVNGRQVKGRLTETELSDGELNVKMLFDAGRKISDLTIRNQIMTDIFNDQANMVIVKVNDFEEGVKLTPQKTEQTFKIK